MVFRSLRASTLALQSDWDNSPLEVDVIPATELASVSVEQPAYWPLAKVLLFIPSISSIPPIGYLEKESKVDPSHKRPTIMRRQSMRFFFVFCFCFCFFFFNKSSE